MYLATEIRSCGRRISIYCLPPVALQLTLTVFDFVNLQLATLLKHFGVAATDDIVPLFYASLVDPLLAMRSQVTNTHLQIYFEIRFKNVDVC
jgi:hypothetical protein